MRPVRFCLAQGQRKSDTVFAHIQQIDYTFLLSIAHNVIWIAEREGAAMEQRAELDATDRRIIKLLIEDASRSNNELAEQVGLSPAPLSRRLARLYSTGVIRQTVVVDPKALGIGFQAFVEVTLERTASKVGQRFIELVSRMPEVVECHTVAGDFDFLLKIAVRDVADYKRLLWSEFEQIAEIKTQRSTILLDSPKIHVGALP
ncbi:Lrp/AsnC family leucine-responsive transcriptional regulator [Sinorhizobium fredii]